MNPLRKSRRMSVTLAALLVGLGLAAGTAGRAAGGESASTDTLVFALSSDPLVLDPALENDGVSDEVNRQIYDTLLKSQPGRTGLAPDLAVSWKPNAKATTWTFHLRRGVRFQDGTPFNARAVCYNFNRWYNFRGALQSPSASVVWQSAFGGFKNTVGKKSAPEKLQTSLYKSCNAVNARTVKLNLTKPSTTIIYELTQTSFAIASPHALKKYHADLGNVDSSGTFHATGEFGRNHPVGTGPFKFVSWQRGDKLVLASNDRYWDGKPKISRLIFRPIPDNSARLQALQTGEIQGYDLVEPQDISTIRSDHNLKLLIRPPANTAFLGFTQTFKPLNDVRVRKAIAYAIDKKKIVSSFYGGLGIVAKQFLPRTIPGATDNAPKYAYNPQRAKKLLHQTGLPLPIKVTFCYPTNVSRPYMPDPTRNFQAMASDLEQVGFSIKPRALPWTPDFIGAIFQGKCPMWLVGQTAEFANASYMYDLLSAPQPLYGFRNSRIFRIMDRAASEPNPAKQVRLYEAATRALMAFVPSVPYAHSKSALAFAANVNGYKPNPFGAGSESFARVWISGS